TIRIRGSARDVASHCLGRFMGAAIFVADADAQHLRAQPGYQPDSPSGASAHYLSFLFGQRFCGSAVRFTWAVTGLVFLLGMGSEHCNYAQAGKITRRKQLRESNSSSAGISVSRRLCKSGLSFVLKNF